VGSVREVLVMLYLPSHADKADYETAEDEAAARKNSSAKRARGARKKISRR
jgi:hypothetical protein